MSQLHANGAAPAAAEASVTVSTTEFNRLLQQQRVEAAPLPIVNGKISPTDFEGIQRIAKWLMATKMVPRGYDDLAKVMLCIADGLALGFSPTQSLRFLAPINGKSCIYGDALPAKVHQSGKCRLWDEAFIGLDPHGNVTETTVAVCRLKRDGYEGIIERRFSVADAKRAGLWGKNGPWKDYPQRMLQMRARAWACRDLFADVLGGLGIVEEEGDVPPPRGAGTGAVSDKASEASKAIDDLLGQTPETATTPGSNPEPANNDSEPSMEQLVNEL